MLTDMGHQIAEILVSVTERLRSAPYAVVFDIDETILDSVVRWQQEIRLRMNLDMPMVEIERHGGIINMLHSLARYEEFEHFAERLWADESFNSSLPVIEGALANIQKLQTMPNLCLGCYLTTRPESLTQATSVNLEQLGFPSLPIIARPDYISRTNTTQWKLAVLE